MALAIPEVDRASMVFGDIRHMPKYSEVPDEFKRRHNPYARAVSSWFFSGVSMTGASIIAGGVKFTAKEGVNANKALAAIAAVMRSFEPKHEHKEAACAYMLSEWFVMEPKS